MKKIFFMLPIIFSVGVCFANQTLPKHLVCETSVSEHDPKVKTSYDVKITEYQNGIVLNIDGQSFVLAKNLEKDGTVYYYSEKPWYNLRINDPQMKDSKYNLGIPTDEPFVRYTVCKEVK